MRAPHKGARLQEDLSQGSGRSVRIVLSYSTPHRRWALALCCVVLDALHECVHVCINNKAAQHVDVYVAAGVHLASTIVGGRTLWCRHEATLAGSSAPCPEKYSAILVEFPKMVALHGDCTRGKSVFAGHSQRHHLAEETAWAHNPSACTNMVGPARAPPPNGGGEASHAVQGRTRKSMFMFTVK